MSACYPCTVCGGDPANAGLDTTRIRLDDPDFELPEEGCDGVICKACYSKRCSDLAVIGRPVSKLARKIIKRMERRKL